jgi:hypothetical protein
MLNGWVNGQRWPAEAGLASNELEVRIEGDHVIAYINGYEVDDFVVPGLSAYRYVGLIGGDWEITPTQVGYDYFYVDQGCDDY